MCDPGKQKWDFLNLTPPLSIRISPRKVRILAFGLKNPLGFSISPVLVVAMGRGRLFYGGNFNYVKNVPKLLRITELTLVIVVFLMSRYGGLFHLGADPPIHHVRRASLYAYRQYWLMKTCSCRTWT